MALKRKEDNKLEKVGTQEGLNLLAVKSKSLEQIWSKYVLWNLQGINININRNYDGKDLILTSLFFAKVSYYWQCVFHSIKYFILSMNVCLFLNYHYC